jgi:DNA-binding transcriptional LysR family regulator
MQRIHSASLDLNLLKVFDALMQTRSASRAALLLGLSQSAVSHALGRLRESTGDPLFIRSAGRMEPTDRAQRLAEPLREALILAASALVPDLDQAFDPAASRRVFTIGAGDYAATVMLPGLLAEIAEAGWGVRLAVLPIDRDAALDMVDSGRIDLAIGLLNQARRWQERVVLFEEVQSCLFDGPRLGITAPIPLEQFCALPHLVPSLHADFATFVDEELAALGLARRSILASAHFLSLPLMLKRVSALASLPRRLCLACANAAALTVSPLPVPARSFDVSMLWHRRDTASPAHRWLRERLAAHNPASATAPPDHPGG